MGTTLIRVGSYIPTSVEDGTLFSIFWCIDFTVEEGGSAEPTRDKKHHRHVPQEGVVIRSPLSQVNR